MEFKSVIKVKSVQLLNILTKAVKVKLGMCYGANVLSIV